jgi:hypothetical protein
MVESANHIPAPMEKDIAGPLSRLGGLCHEAPALPVARSTRPSATDQSTTLRVDSSSTSDSRLRGARPSPDGRFCNGNTTPSRLSRCGRKRRVPERAFFVRRPSARCEAIQHEAPGCFTRRAPSGVTPRTSAARRPCPAPRPRSISVRRRG